MVTGECKRCGTVGELGERCDCREGGVPFGVTFDSWVLLTSGEIVQVFDCRGWGILTVTEEKPAILGGLTGSGAAQWEEVVGLAEKPKKIKRGEKRHGKRSKKPRRGR